MSYQVFARKYRPKNFQQVIGQTHVVRALVNALDQKRLHHAYLFSGTRGVGKTTLARIFAKCLNCEAGPLSIPCGQCRACLEIDSGCYIDLIEVDAASRTKVEDTRTLLDNVQYASTHARFKIYLIDEVHMLSSHSFNALLKTLEEPPEHVKFLLATTDPQKLPATVLSRCLQFHLKHLSPDIIANHLALVLNEEKMTYEQEALRLIAQAAEGSVRDALSLLDQAVSFCGNSVKTEQIRTLLGTVDNTFLFQLLDALCAKETKAIFTIINELDENGVDFQQALEGLLSLLHRIALAQALPESIHGSDVEKEKIRLLSRAISPEEVQLYYQIALSGRRDLPLAPLPRIGFEMQWLRLLAFTPTLSNEIRVADRVNEEASEGCNKAENSSAKNSDSSQWNEIISRLSLTGMTQALAFHCVLHNKTDNIIELMLHEKHKPLLTDAQKQRLQEALSVYYQQSIKLVIKLGETSTETPAAHQETQKMQKQQALVKAFATHPTVQAIMEQFNGKIDEDSVETLSENWHN